MVIVIADIKTEIRWIKSISEIPIIGGVFAFLLILIPPVIGSFTAQAIIPGLEDDMGFTKAMLLLLPTWNLSLWLIEIKTRLFYVPAWMLLSAIAMVKAATIFFG